MGLNKKGKRKITFQDQIYYWHILSEFGDYSSMLSLNIVSEDKKFIIKYYIIQYDTEESYTMKIIGDKFPKLSEQIKKRPVRINCPKLIDDGKKNIEPKDVRLVLEWCFKKGR